MRKIGILTGGGECPGINSIFKSIVPKCLVHDIEVYGFEKGWEGVMKKKYRPLTIHELDEAHILGSSILESSRVNIFNEPDAYDLSLIHISEPTRPY